MALFSSKAAIENIEIEFSGIIFEEGYDPSIPNSDRLVRRLSKDSLERTSWQLFNTEGSPLFYENHEKDYWENSIEGKEIILPVGTRVVKLGRTDRAILNGKFGALITCFHHGKYRVGLVEMDSMVNSVKGRVNLQEKESFPELMAAPFLDDGAQILNYCNKTLDLIPEEHVVNSYRVIIEETQVLFQQVLARFSSINDYNTGLNNLDLILSSLAPLSDGIGNLATNFENKVDSIERWKDFSPLVRILDEKPTPYNTWVVPISRHWMEEWRGKNEEFNSYVEETLVDIEGENTPVIVSLYDELFADGASNYRRLLGEEVNPDYLKYAKAIEKLIDFMEELPDSESILETSEAQYLLSLDKNEFQTYEFMILIGPETWTQFEGSGAGSLVVSGIATDYSIGYINVPSGLSIYVHETNTFQDFNTSGKPFLFDTHTADSDATMNWNEFVEKIKEDFSGELAFEVFEVMEGFSVATFGPYPVLYYPMHANILFLNYYLTRLMSL